VSTELPVGSTKGVVTVDWRSTGIADLAGTASTLMTYGSDRST
jgi:hypothetical protein